MNIKIYQDHQDEKPVLRHTNCRISRKNRGLLNFKSKWHSTGRIASPVKPFSQGKTSRFSQGFNGQATNNMRSLVLIGKDHLPEGVPCDCTMSCMFSKVLGFPTVPNNQKNHPPGPTLQLHSSGSSVPEKRSCCQKQRNALGNGEHIGIIGKNLDKNHFKPNVSTNRMLSQISCRIFCRFPKV